MKIRYFFLPILIFFTVSCSSIDTKEEKKESPKILEMEKNGSDYFDVYDPWEPLNRRVYYFNAKFDEYVFIPVVDTYHFITPDALEKGVYNFFRNLSEIKTFFNSSLQIKGRKSLITFNRFAINSTIGVFGFFDVASRVGLLKQKEDFGQTLGHYGVNPGPYLVLPIFGPSTLRDSTGLGIDIIGQNYADPLKIADSSRMEPEILSLNSIDNRSSVNFRYYSIGTPFEYEYMRFFYTKLRALEVEN